MQSASDSAAPAAEAPPPSVWDRLADRLNPALERPKLVEGVEGRLLSTSRGEQYYIVKNPLAGTYVRLAVDEYFLLGLMDGTRQVKDLVLAYFLQHKSFAFQRIAHVVAQLRQYRFLTEEPRDAWGGLSRKLMERTWVYKVDQAIRTFKYHEWALDGIDGAMTTLYRRIGWLFFTRPAVILLVLVSSIGIGLFVWQLTHGARNPLTTGGSYALGLLVLMALMLVTVSIHEAGHAMATKYFGREVPRGGIMLYYGFPAFFMDTTDIWMEPRRARMVVSAAGMAAVWGLGGVAMILYMFIQDTAFAPFLLQFAFVAFINNSFNLLPLLELDGYFLLMDWLELPLLRSRALAFVQGEMWRKVKTRERFNREERIFTVFGSLALLYSVFALTAAVYFWFTRIRLLIVDAWHSDTLLLRAVVAIVILMFGVPFLFGMGFKLHQLASSARGGLARLRHRREEARARVRLDARELVGRLRFLGELGFAQREEVVSQLHLETYKAGQYVVRQGDPGENFYLIRQGQAEVLQVGADGWPRELALLGRGDYFGEIALLYHQTRTASVRALSKLEVLALGRAAFETTIAPRLHDYGLTVQWIEERSELGRMSLFRHTRPSELDPILDRLRSEEFAAGTVILRQGEPGDRFYLVRSGRVRVRRAAEDGSEVVLGELTTGEYFGEMALLSDAPRAATVEAIEPTRVWSLDKTAFHELLLGQFQLSGALSTEAERRSARHLRLAGERAA
ncbi:MAG TPA: cyclic nucleotide-binding domain-containing protein [Chloroflexota bacterium]|nr:cyclic nucleotide-binding domain-containing protein [Chloroflexota bacterium]